MHFLSSSLWLLSHLTCGASHSHLHSAFSKLSLRAASKVVNLPQIAGGSLEASAGPVSSALQKQV